MTDGRERGEFLPSELAPGTGKNPHNNGLKSFPKTSPLGPLSETPLIASQAPHPVAEAWFTTFTAKYIIKSQTKQRLPVPGGMWRGMNNSEKILASVCINHKWPLSQSSTGSSLQAAELTPMRSAGSPPFQEEAKAWSPPTVSLRATFSPFDP